MTLTSHAAPGHATLCCHHSTLSLAHGKITLPFNVVVVVKGVMEEHVVTVVENWFPVCKGSGPLIIGTFHDDVDIDPIANKKFLFCPRLCLVRGGVEGIVAAAAY